jgi:hypothetical protein
VRSALRRADASERAATTSINETEGNSDDR